MFVYVVALCLECGSEKWDGSEESGKYLGKAEGLWFLVVGGYCAEVTGVKVGNKCCSKVSCCANDDGFEAFGGGETYLPSGDP